MRKFLYIFTIILVLISCSNNSDQPTIITPPEPTPVDITADDLIGDWEIYYFVKNITANQTAWKGFRLIDDDGFRTVFSKEDGEYKVKTLNVVGDELHKGTYSVVGDTIYFNAVAYKDGEPLKGKDGKDSMIYTNYHVREFGVTPGIMKLDLTYYGQTPDKTWYKVVDVKFNRNLAIAPNSTQGVESEKHIINFDDLTEGKWNVYEFQQFYDGQLQREYSKVMLDTLSLLMYKFKYDTDGDYTCGMVEWDYKNKKWSDEIVYPIAIVDDVIHFFYWAPVEDPKTGEYVRDETGEIVYEPASFYMNITKWENKKGFDSFIDNAVDRYKEDLSILVRKQMYLKRVADDWFPDSPK